MISHTTRVSNAAYSLWEAAGHPEGQDLEFWYEAELRVSQAGRTKPSPITKRRAVDLTTPECSGNVATTGAHRQVIIKRAVVVEDSSQTQQLIGLVLQSLGVSEIAMASNGEEALALIKSGGADIVIMDRMMDVMDGLECTRRIRQGVDGIDPKLPIILLTSVAGEVSEKAAYDVGVDLFLSKPFSIKKLTSGLCAVLGAREGLG